MEIKHVCMDCRTVMAVHEHSSYQEIKDCLTGMRALCPECRRYIGSPLPTDGMRSQEVNQ
jgi:hypothetical protein